MSSSPKPSSSKQDPSQYLRVEPAPQVPFPLKVQNIGLEVRPGENIAYGWHPWVATDDGYKVPTFMAGELEGKRVQRIVSNHRYDAALLQRVKAPAGLAVNFQMKFRITPDDSTSKRVRPQGIVVGVGIDPIGGEDVRSDNVQWALRDLKYSQVVTASVITTSQKEMVTAFVRIVAFIPGSGGELGNGTANGCTLICNKPNYTRTYLLLPTNATQQMWINAAQLAFQQRWTMGGSADDAGLGAVLLAQTPIVKVVNYPGSWDSNFGDAWFDLHYSPGVEFHAVTLSG